MDFVEDEADVLPEEAEPHLLKLEYPSAETAALGRELNSLQENAWAAGGSLRAIREAASMIPRAVVPVDWCQSLRKPPHQKDKAAHQDFLDEILVEGRLLLAVAYDDEGKD